MDEIFTNMMESDPKSLELIFNSQHSHNEIEQNNNEKIEKSSLDNSMLSNSNKYILKKVYSRENVLHENTTKYVNLNSNVSSNTINQVVKETSENKNLDNKYIRSNFDETKQTEHHESGALLKNVIGLPVERRLSAPILINNTDVLTASFQIPLQITQTTGQSLHSNEELDEHERSLNFIIHDDINNISLLEEKKDNNIANYVEKGIRKSSTMNSMLANLSSRRSSNNKLSSTTKHKTEDNSRSISTEPKKTPSINNIGNKVMKSTAANFEQKLPLSSSNRDHQNGPIYKRQEIISSAQYSKNK